MTKRNKEVYDRVIKHHLFEIIGMSKMSLNRKDINTIVPFKTTYEGVLIQSDPPIYARLTLEFYEEEKQNAKA